MRGEVLEDEPYATWALDLRGSYQGRVLGARLEAADAALAERDFAPALAHAEAAAAFDRFSERAYRTQMLALYALGRPHEALNRYRELPHPAGRRARPRARPGHASLESAILRQEEVHSLLPRPIGASRAQLGDAARTAPGPAAELDTAR